MKKHNNNIPAAAKLNLLRQTCNFIPDFLVPKLARATGVQEKARTFSPWTHLVALMHAQLTHSIGLNDVCAALGLHSGPLSSLRGATPPNRNTLSHANTVRPAEMAEQLFWAVLEHLGSLSPGFVGDRSGKRFARKFKRTIHLMDSTTSSLIASCLDWAKENLNCRVVRCFQQGVFGKILRDDLIKLQTPLSRDAYPVELRRIVALVEVDGRKAEMEFLTNNLE